MEIIIIAIIFFVIKMTKEKHDEAYEANKKQMQNKIPNQIPKQASRDWDRTWEEVNRAKQYAQEKEGNEHFRQSSMHKQQENRDAMKQVQESRAAANNTTILERAQANTAGNKSDITLETMEAEHNHSERVSAAVHHHPEDVMTESMLGTVEDLMVKGFDGNLCFERDFLGEAMDMIARFTVPSDVPDFSKDDVA